MCRVGIVVVGGDPPSPSVRDMLPGDPFLVVAADSGFDHALRLGLRVDVLVGDLDSISPGGLALAESTDGVSIERHRPDKDYTDTELAISIAIERGIEHLIGVSGGGDRLDHQLGTLAAFAAAAAQSAVTVELWWRRDHIAIIDGPAHHDTSVAALESVPPPAERTVSLVPFGGPVSGVRTSRMRFPLAGETLMPASARGISNVTLRSDAAVDIASGTLLIITPGALQ